MMEIQYNMWINNSYPNKYGDDIQIFINNIEKLHINTNGTQKHEKYINKYILRDIYYIIN